MLLLAAARLAWASHSEEADVCAEVLRVDPVVGGVLALEVRVLTATMTAGYGQTRALRLHFEPEEAIVPAVGERRLFRWTYQDGMTPDGPSSSETWHLTDEVGCRGRPPPPRGIPPPPGETRGFTVELPEGLRDFTNARTLPNNQTLIAAPGHPHAVMVTPLMEITRELAPPPPRGLDHLHRVMEARLRERFRFFVAGPHTEFTENGFRGVEGGGGWNDPRGAAHDPDAEDEEAGFFEPRPTPVRYYYALLEKAGPWYSIEASVAEEDAARWLPRFRAVTRSLRPAALAPGR